MASGYTAELGDQDKHSKNDVPCAERGWVCVLLVVWYLVVGEMRHKKLCKEASHQDNSLFGLRC